MGYRNEHENIVPVFMYPDKENSCIINVLIKKIAQFCFPAFITNTFPIKQMTSLKKA